METHVSGRNGESVEYLDRFKVDGERQAWAWHHAIEICDQAGVTFPEGVTLRPVCDDYGGIRIMGVTPEPAIYVENMSDASWRIGKSVDHIRKMAAKRQRSKKWIAPETVTVLCLVVPDAQDGEFGAHVDRFNRIYGAPVAASGLRVCFVPESKIERWLNNEVAQVKAPE